MQTLGMILMIAGYVIAADAGKESPTFTPQITGTLGSPSATTTISGKQLPAPQPPFGGVMWSYVVPAILFAIALGATIFLYRHFAGRDG